MLRNYVKRTILAAAREYAYPATRRNAESTESAFRDAMNGTDTGWWNDLIYVEPMLAMAHKYRRDIAAALREYRNETGESYVYRSRDYERETSAETILAALLCGPHSFQAYHNDSIEADAALIGLRFAVNWRASMRPTFN